MMSQGVLYSDKLAAEWADWVEMPNPTGSREKELFPELVQWVAKVRPANVLDIGCGQGIISSLIPDEVTYLGVDISEPLIARAKNKYPASKKAFQVGSAYKLPADAESFDAVISFWVWSHLESPDKAANEMSRVLKPNGHYLVITANPATYDARRTFYSKYQEKDGLIIGNFDLGNGKQLTNTTLYLHTIEDFCSALKQAGLSIDNNKSLGMLDEYPEGLYLALSGRKEA